MAAAREQSAIAKVKALLEEREWKEAARATESRVISALPVARVLRARAFTRLGMRDEALALTAEALRLAAGRDAEVVFQSALVFRAAGDEPQCAALLEAASVAAIAAAASPATHASSIALQRGLVFSLVRLGDWRRMQAVALRLSKSAVAAAAATAHGTKASAGSEYLTWAALALHCATNDPLASGTGPAPLAVSGGGRGFGSRTVRDPVTARALALGEALVERALDALGLRERSSETIGLLVHTYVRAGRSADGFRALTGKYAFLADADASTLAAPGAPSSVATDGAAAGFLSPFPAEGALAGDASSAAVPSSRGVPPPVPLAAVLSSSSSAAPHLLDHERTADDYIAEAADGLEGRGASPGPLLLVDFLRLCAYTLTLAAQSADAVAAANISPAAPAPAPASALLSPPAGLGPGGCGGSATGSWEAARHAYALLLTDARVPQMHDDWAVHCGLAVASASLLSRAAAAAAACGDWAAAAAVLAPVDGEGCVSGAELVDARLRPLARIAAAQQPSDLFCSASSSACAPPAPFPAEARASALAVLLHQAVRLELLHRLALVATGGAGAEPLHAAFAAGGAAFLRLLCLYVASVANKPCCFSDVALFLPPLLAAEAGARDVDCVALAADEAAMMRMLRGFMCVGGGDGSGLGVLAVPFMPLAGAGQASDQSPAQPLFRFSFVLPRAGIDALLLPLLKRMREQSRPDAALAAQLCEVVSSARSRALLAERAASAARGGAKGQRTAAAPVAVDDPHGVAAALAPALELALLPDQEALLRGSRGRVRTYLTALQLQRYLGPLTLQRSDGGDAPVEAAEAERLQRADADEVVEAWRHSLPLSWATIGGQKEGLESDDLPLLAAHLLWELAFRHEHAAFQLAAADGPASRRLALAYASRQLLLESALLLQCAACASEHNSQFNLALLRVHAWLAANVQVLTEFRRLRVKHVAIDTLGHLALPHLLRTTWCEAAQGLCSEVCEFHRSAQRDCGDHAAAALASGNLSAALDLLRLRQRLARSATLALAHAGHARNALAAGARSATEAATLLRRCALSGEIPDLWVGDAADVGTLAALRDNDEREAASAWDAPSGPQLEDVRGLESLAPGAGLAVAAAQAIEASLAPLVGASATPPGLVELAARFCLVMPQPQPQPQGAERQQECAAHLALCASAGSGGAAGAACGSSLPARLLRRVLREQQLGFTQHVFVTLSRCLEGGPAATAGAEAALARLGHVLGEAGYVGLELEAVVPFRALRRLLFADVALGLLPVVDTGLSCERAAVRGACMAVLWSSLSAAVCASQAADGAWRGDAAVVACSRAAQHLAAVSEAAAALGGLVVGGMFLAPPPLSSSPDGAAKTAATAELPRTGPLNPVFFAELPLLTQHTLAPALVALGHASRLVLASGGRSGDASDAMRGCVASLTACLTSLQKAAAEAKRKIDLPMEQAMRMVLTGFEPSLCATTFAMTLPVGFEGYDEDATGAVARAGIAPAFAVTTLPLPATSASKKGGKSGKAASAAAVATEVPAAAEVSAAAEAGAAFLVEKRVSQAAAFRKCARGVFQAIAASYTHSLSELHKEITQRLATLKSFGQMR